MASKKTRAAKAKKSGATQSKSKSPYGTKTSFVMNLPREMSAREVVAKGKAQGIKLSEAHVYKIRSTSKSAVPTGKAAKGGRAAKAAPAAKGRAAKAAPAGRKGGRGDSSLESRFVSAAVDLGFTRASELLNKLRGRLK